MKKALMTASVASMIYQFNTNNIKMLQKLGYQVDIACNFDDTSYFSKEKLKEMKEKGDELGITSFNISCPRSIFAVKQMVTTYNKLKRIIDNGHYDIVHTHTPIGSVLTRLACRNARKHGTKVIYTAHGLHFFKGSPKINWVIYYPIEKICSLFTDVIITINQEDYNRARKKFKTAQIKYIPGVGVDIEKFKNVQVSKQEKRKELGLSQNAFVLLSVGELNENKNHQVIIKAVARLKNPNIIYCIAGQGTKYEELVNLTKFLNIEKQVEFIGFRTDIHEIYKIADVFCFPSLREGLGLVAVEAMASGLPLITSNIHGINDYSKNGITGFKCDRFDADAFAKCICKIMKNNNLRQNFSKNNIALAEKFSLENSQKIMYEIYSEI